MRVAYLVVTHAMPDHLGRRLAGLVDAMIRAHDTTGAEPQPSV